jgi:hypothetical protein
MMPFSLSASTSLNSHPLSEVVLDASRDHFTRAELDALYHGAVRVDAQPERTAA